MPKFEVIHTTTYNYARRVRIGPHRLMTRPRDSHELRVLAAELRCTPAATLVWSSDVFGNSVVEATFAEESNRLEIESRIVVEQFAPEWPILPIAARALTFPFVYDVDAVVDVGALTVPQYADPDGQLSGWVQGFIAGPQTDTLALLKDINLGVSHRVCYQPRDEEGTQSPLGTLQHGRGTCRDLAVLFVEAVRWLGFGARIVSGYLHSTTLEQGAGATHAWAEVFLPGAGWIAFDPTNASLGGAHLVRVAVARSIGQVSPISGTFVGDANDYLGMTVSVTVSIV